jgi:hypothetical protein
MPRDVFGDDGSNSSFGSVTVFRPEDFGAQRNGVTDDTAAIKACINAAVTACQSDGTYLGVVQFSSGIYLLSSSTTLGGATLGNAQIPLPIIASTSRKVTLVLRGIGPVTAHPHWEQTVSQQSGTVLKTTLTGQTYDATHGLPSVIGGPTVEHGFATTGALFNNMLVVIDGIMIAAPASPSLCGFDLRGMGETYVADAAAMTASVPPTMPAPPSNFMSGLMMPLNGNNDLCEIGSFSVQGWHRGVLVGEHTNAKRIASVYCRTGIGIGGPNGHGINIEYASVEACIDFVGYVDITPVAWGANGAYFRIGMLDTEVGSGNFAPRYTVDDATNKLVGDISINPDGGADSIVMNGGVNVKLIDISALRGAFTPTLPATTVASTPIFRDMALTVSGGTVTAIAVDGVSQGVTSGTVLVPSGRSFAITYSVAPTLRAIKL